MKVSEFPNEVPTGATKVPVVGEKHFTLQQALDAATVLADARYVVAQPQQAVDFVNGTNTVVYLQRGGNGDMKGGDIIIETGAGGPEHGLVGDIYIRANASSGGGGNVTIQCGNGNAIGEILLGLRGLSAALKITANNQAAILASDNNYYALDVVNGTVTATLV